MVTLALLLAGQHAIAAKYSITEVGDSEKYRRQYALGINDNGDVVGGGREGVNLRFYLEDYLTSDTATIKTSYNLSEVELSTAEFDADSIDCLISQLGRTGDNAPGSSSEYQKIGDVKSFIDESGVSTYTPITDVYDE